MRERDRGRDTESERGQAKVQQELSPWPDFRLPRQKQRSKLRRLPLLFWSAFFLVAAQAHFHRGREICRGEHAR